MVEVFKTDVTNRSHADEVIDEIHKRFADYKANFDLDDCDNILRVECSIGSIDSSVLKSFIQAFGYTAEVLPGDDMSQN